MRKIGDINPNDQKNLQDGSVAGPDRGHKLRLDLCVTQHATVAARTPEDWLRRVEQDGHGFIEWRSLTEQEQAEEALLMGLRLREGVPLARVTGALDQTALNRLTEDSFVETNGALLIATHKGRPVLNAVLGALVAG